jgi:hypothetical protein
MASGIYGPGIRHSFIGSIDYDTDTFKVMALGASYAEDFDAHDFRSDLTNEVSGTGYTAGGNTVTVTVAAYDTVNNRLVLTLGGTTWPTSTITGAQKFAYYKSRGGASSADELVALVDNGTALSTTGTTLTLNSSTITVQL